MRKLYYVIDCGKNDEWTIGKYESKEKAIEEARSHWNHLSDHDKKGTIIEVRDYEDDIENEDCTNFDYDTFDWGYIIRDKSGSEIDTLPTEDEAADRLTEYLLDVGEEECDMEEDDIYILKKRMEELMNLYEILDPAAGSTLRMYWDLNDLCVCTY